MSLFSSFAPDSATIVLLILTAALLVVVVCPLLFLICRLRDVGHVRRVHPLLVAHHVVASLVGIGVLLVRVVVFSLSTNNPATFTVPSCEIFVKSVPSLWRARAVRDAAVQMWLCVSQSYRAPFELVTSSSTSPSLTPRLAHSDWWRRVGSIWLPVAVVVTESVTLLVLIATFINMETALWQDGVRSVAAAIRKGNLDAYMLSTRRFLRGARLSVTTGSSSGAATMSVDSSHHGARHPSHTPDAYSSHAQGGGRHAATAAASSSAAGISSSQAQALYSPPDALMEDMFDNSVRVRGPISARRAHSQSLSTFFGSRSHSGQGRARSAVTTESQPDTTPANSASFLSVSMSFLRRSLRLPRFRRGNDSVDAKEASAETRKASRADELPARRAVADALAAAAAATPPLTSHRGPLVADGSSRRSSSNNNNNNNNNNANANGGSRAEAHADDSGPLGGFSSSAPLSTGSGSGFSFGSVSEASGSNSALLPAVFGDTVTVRPRLNVRSLALQQELLKAQEKQRRQQAQQRQVRYQRELLSSFWTTRPVTFALAAIPYMLICGCRIMMLFVSVQVSSSFAGTSPVVAHAAGAFGGRTSLPTTAPVVYIAPIDGYLGLAAALVLLADYINATRFVREVGRLHQSRAAREALPPARPPGAITIASVMILIASQVCPQAVHLWATAALAATVYLCLTMIKFTLVPIQQTLCEYQPAATGHSRAALLLGLWFHPVEGRASSAAQQQQQQRHADATVVETVEERRRSRRVVLATQAATAAVTAMNNASHGNPMAAEDAATTAARAAQQLLREELVDELAGGVEESVADEDGYDDGAGVSPGSDSPLASSMTHRGGVGGLANGSFALQEAIAYAAAAVQNTNNESHGASPYSPNGNSDNSNNNNNNNNNDGSSGSVSQFLPPVPPLSVLSLTSLGGTPEQTAARAATNFWEGIATRVHQQYNDGDDDELVGSGGTNAHGAAGSVGIPPALLASVEVRTGADLSAPVLTTIPTSCTTTVDGSLLSVSASTMNNDSCSSLLLQRGSTTAMMTAAAASGVLVPSAALVSALVPDAPSEGIDDVTEETTTTTTSISGAMGDSTNSDSGGERRKLSNASFQRAAANASMPGQHHNRQARRHAPATAADAISSTRLGDLHGSILLKAPMAISLGAASTLDADHLASLVAEAVTAEGHQASREDDDADPLHPGDGSVDNTGLSPLATDSSGADDDSSSSSIPAALRKSFALLARPSEWFNRGANDGKEDSAHNDSHKNDEGTGSGHSEDASSATQHGSRGTFDTTSSSTWLSASPKSGHEDTCELPMLILDPPSDKDNESTMENTADGLTSGLPTRLAPAAPPGNQSFLLSTSPSSLSTPSVANSAAMSALSEDGRSAAMVATAAKAARALRAVAVGNADDGFPIFLNAVRHAGNNLTLLRELMAPTGTRYVHMRDADGRTALHHTALGNFIHGTVFLLQMGAEPNARDGKGLTPLHLAVIAQCDYAVHPDIDDDPGHTSRQDRPHQSPTGRALPPRPTSSSTSSSRTATVSGGAERTNALLPSPSSSSPIARPASAFAQVPVSSTAMVVDAEAGTMAGFPASAAAVTAIKQARRPHRTWRGVVNALVRGGADVNATTEDGRTPLHMVIAKELVGAVQTLLREGADPLASWENEDEAEVATPGSGRWVEVHVTNGGVVAGTTFRKSPLMYALELGSSMSVASILSFVQLGEEILRMEEALEGTAPLPSRLTSSSADNVTSLKSLLKKKKMKRRPSSAGPQTVSSATTPPTPLSAHAPETSGEALPSAVPPIAVPVNPLEGSGVFDPAAASMRQQEAEARELEAVKASALVPPTKRRRGVIAKTTARAVARTASTVAAAMAAAYSERQHWRVPTASRRGTTGPQQELLTSTPPKSPCGVHHPSGATPVSACPSATLTTFQSDASTSSSNSLSGFAGAWGLQFMPQCLHGLTILDIALVLGQTNVVETVLRHHMLWFQQTRVRDDQRRRSRKANALKNPRTAKTYAESVNTASLRIAYEDKFGETVPGDDDGDELMEEVDTFTDNDQDEDVTSSTSCSSHHSDGRSARRPGGVATRHGRRRRRGRFQPLRSQTLQEDYHQFLQSMLLPALAGSAASVVRGVAEAASAYAEAATGPGQPLHVASEVDKQKVMTHMMAIDKVSCADALEAVDAAAATTTATLPTVVSASPEILSSVRLAAAHRRQTLFHFVAMGDSTEAVAYVLNALGMPDFVPEGNPFSGFDTAWCVQHPHRTRDTRMLSRVGHTVAVSQSTRHSMAATTTTTTAALSSGGPSIDSQLARAGSGVFCSPGRLTLAATGVFDSTRTSTRGAALSTSATTTTTYAPVTRERRRMEAEGGPLSQVGSTVSSRATEQKDSSSTLSAMAPTRPPSTATSIASFGSPTLTLRETGDDEANERGAPSDSESGVASAVGSESGGAAAVAAQAAAHAMAQQTFLAQVVAVMVRFRHQVDKAAEPSENASVGHGGDSTTSPATAVTTTTTTTTTASALFASPTCDPSNGVVSFSVPSSSQTHLTPRAALAADATRPLGLSQSGSGSGSVHRPGMSWSRQDTTTTTTRAKLSMTRSAGSVTGDAYSPWKNARRRIDAHREQLQRQPLMYGQAPNMLRAVPMPFNTAVMKLRQRVPTIPIDLAHLAALEAAVDHVCHSALDMAGQEIHRLQRALLVVSLHLQQQLVQQRARRRRKDWYPRAAGLQKWKWQPSTSSSSQQTQPPSRAKKNTAPFSAPPTTATTPTCEVKDSPLLLQTTTTTTFPERTPSTAAPAPPGHSGRDTSPRLPADDLAEIGAMMRQVSATVSSSNNAAHAPHSPTTPTTPLDAQPRVRVSIARMMMALNSIDEYGLTPLHYVIANHNANMVYILCCHGAVFTFASAETRGALSGILAAVRPAEADVDDADGGDTLPSQSRTSTPARAPPPPPPTTTAEMANASMSASAATPNVSTTTAMTTTTTATTTATGPNDEPPRQTTQESVSGSSPGGSGWIEASAIPVLTAPAGAVTEVCGGDRDGDGDGKAGQNPPTLSGITHALPSTPQMDSFLSSTPPPAGEARVGLHRVSLGDTDETQAAMADGSALLVVAAPPSALTTGPAKPPLAPVNATTTPSSVGGGGGSDTSGGEQNPLLELLSAPSATTEPLTNRSVSDKASYSWEAARERSFLLDKTDVVNQASVMLYSYGEAYASQMPVEICDAVDRIADERSARHFLESLEAITYASRTQPPMGTPSEKEPSPATPTFAPMMGTLLEPHDMFTLHAVRDAALAASIIHAGLEGMAVWEEKSSRYTSITMTE